MLPVIYAEKQTWNRKMNASLTPPASRKIQHHIFDKKILCKIDSASETSENLHLQCESYFPSHHAIHQKKNDCLFRVDPPVAYSADSDWLLGEDPSGLQRRSGGKNPVQAQICSLCSEQWEIQWRCLSDVTDQKWKIEGKTLPLSVPPTRNSFHELCDGSPIQKRKSRPLQSSTNLLPLHELASCLPFVLCCS